MTTSQLARSRVQTPQQRTCRTAPAQIHTNACQHTSHPLVRSTQQAQHDTPTPHTTDNQKSVLSDRVREPRTLSADALSALLAVDAPNPKLFELDGNAPKLALVLDAAPGKGALSLFAASLFASPAPPPPADGARALDGNAGMPGTPPLPLPQPPPPPPPPPQQTRRSGARSPSSSKRDHVRGNFGRRKLRRTCLQVFF